MSRQDKSRYGKNFRMSIKSVPNGKMSITSGDKFHAGQYYLNEKVTDKNCTWSYTNSNEFSSQRTPSRATFDFLHSYISNDISSEVNSGPIENDKIRQNFDDVPFIILFTKGVSFLKILIDPKSKFNYIDQAYATKKLQLDTPILVNDLNLVKQHICFDPFPELLKSTDPIFNLYNFNQRYNGIIGDMTLQSVNALIDIDKNELVVGEEKYPLMFQTSIQVNEEKFVTLLTLCEDGEYQLKCNLQISPGVYAKSGFYKVENNKIRLWAKNCNNKEVYLMREIFNFDSDIFQLVKSSQLSIPKANVPDEMNKFHENSTNSDNYETNIMARESSSLIEEPVMVTSTNKCENIMGNCELNKNQLFDGTKKETTKKENLYQIHNEKWPIGENMKIQPIQFRIAYIEILTHERVKKFALDMTLSKNYIFYNDATQCEIDSIYNSNETSDFILYNPFANIVEVENDRFFVMKNKSFYDGVIGYQLLSQMNATISCARKTLEIGNVIFQLREHFQNSPLSKNYSVARKGSNFHKFSKKQRVLHENIDRQNSHQDRKSNSSKQENQVQELNQLIVNIRSKNRKRKRNQKEKAITKIKIENKNSIENHVAKEIIQPFRNKNNKNTGAIPMTRNCVNRFSNQIVLECNAKESDVKSKVFEYTYRRKICKKQFDVFDIVKILKESLLLRNVNCILCPSNLIDLVQLAFSQAFKQENNFKIFISQKFVLDIETKADEQKILTKHYEKYGNNIENNCISIANQFFFPKLKQKVINYIKNIEKLKK